MNKHIEGTARMYRVNGVWKIIIEDVPGWVLNDISLEIQEKGGIRYDGGVRHGSTSEFMNLVFITEAPIETKTSVSIDQRFEQE